MVRVTIYLVVILVCCPTSLVLHKILSIYVLANVCFTEHGSSGRGSSLGGRDNTFHQNGRASYSSTAPVEMQAQSQPKAGSNNIRLAIQVHVDLFKPRDAALFISLMHL